MEMIKLAYIAFENPIKTHMAPLPVSGELIAAHRLKTSSISRWSCVRR